MYGERGKWGDYSWFHVGEEDDIIAYKLAEQLTVKEKLSLPAYYCEDKLQDTTLDVWTSQSQPTTSNTLSVKAANQTGLGEVGVHLELGIVNHILTLEQAKELNTLLVEVLDQFALELFIGDVVSDNEQALIVRGIVGDNIWCENEQSRQFFTKKRNELFLTHKVVH